MLEQVQFVRLDMQGSITSGWFDPEYQEIVDIWPKGEHLWVQVKRRNRESEGK